MSNVEFACTRKIPCFKVSANVDPVTGALDLFFFNFESTLLVIIGHLLT